MHNRPTISPSMLLQNMYQNPVIAAPLGPDGFPIKVDERKAQRDFEVGLWWLAC
jgi:splicing factor U2AF 35 kDa subunit